MWQSVSCVTEFRIEANQTTAALNMSVPTVPPSEGHRSVVSARSATTSKREKRQSGGEEDGTMQAKSFKCPCVQANCCWLKGVAKEVRL